MIHRIKWFSAAALLVSAAAPAAVPSAEPPGLRGDFGGLWYTPERSGQGLHVDVLDGSRATVSWFTYDEQGKPVWLFGVGKVRGFGIEVDVDRAVSGSFALSPTHQTPSMRPAGTLRLAFAGCGDALLSFTATPDGTGGAGLPGGTLPLKRLSQPAGVRCNAEEEFAEQRVLSFEQGTLGFVPLFFDLPLDNTESFDLDFGWERLPAPLEDRRGLRLTGQNRSDDLAMTVKGALRGLLPNRRYRIELETELATNVPAGCVGIGGAPGEAVVVKLGATTSEPQTVVVGTGADVMLRPSFDFGNQSVGGTQALRVGDITNGEVCESATHEWRLKTLSTLGQRFFARTDAEGTLWVVAGTDSGFEGRTEIFLTSLRIRLQPMPNDAE